MLREATFLPGPTVTGTRALAIPTGGGSLEIYAHYVLLDSLGRGLQAPGPSRHKSIGST